MTKEKQLRIIRRQIKAMMRDFEKECLKKAEKALKSSAVPPEYIDGLEKDEFLLAKAVVDSEMRNRPYSPLSPSSKKEFENIHICL